MYAFEQQTAAPEPGKSIHTLEICLASESDSASCSMCGQTICQSHVVVDRHEFAVKRYCNACAAKQQPDWIDAWLKGLLIACGEEGAKYVEAGTI